MQNLEYLKWIVTSYPTRRSNNPGILQKIAIKFYSLFLNLRGINFDFDRYLRVNSIRNNSLKVEPNLPPIEVMVPAAIKDLDSAMLTIASVFRYSANPITKVLLIVPESDVEIFRNRITLLSLENILVQSENEVLGDTFIKRLKENFPIRFGWVLAEFLKFKIVFSSKANGILVIDADTILTNSRVWLTSNHSQELFPVYEYHKHYFEYLERIGVAMANVDTSFMSHYLLFQPKIYRELFFETTVSDEFGLLNTLIGDLNLDSHSPVCFCYEAYSHFALKRYPERMMITKWSNTQVSRKKLIGELEKYLSIGQRYFNSISSHSYL